ncbi:MAG TPA: rod shape-determining protein RodA [Firmicutes bacterium]|nr:rod shape-determining protein RodA [Bacillota bacterium]
MLVDRRLARNLDYGLLFATLALVVFGIIIIYSATYANKGENLGDPFYFVKRQALAAVLGVLALFIILNIDYRLFERIRSPIYFGNIALLAAVLVAGQRISGAQSWFRLGPLALQPSELAKVAVIITLADHLVKRDDIDSFWGLIPPFVHAGIPMALILLQNDLGTVLVFGAIVLGMVYVAGARTRDLAVIAGGLGALSPFIYFFLLKPYQRARLLIFLNPYRDPMGDGYNVIQSTIAIGSGRLFGKGLFGGTQAKLNFLPAHHTDFIFSVVGEELGFIGAVIVLLVYFFIIWRCLQASWQAKDKYGSLLAAGVASMLLFHVLINIGMTMSVMPVTGIPLPFLSYGGSAMLADLIAIGIVLNVHMRRQKILF